MERFGGDLRSERERRNVSLETISAITKVPSRYLFALEADEFSTLPHGVFRRGIVRSYLSALGIEELPWMQRFEAALDASGSGLDHPQSLAEFAENVSRSRPSSPPLQSARWIGVTVMMLAVGLLGWSVWFFVLHGRVVLSSLLRIGFSN